MTSYIEVEKTQEIISDTPSPARYWISLSKEDYMKGFYINHEQAQKLLSKLQDILR